MQSKLGLDQQAVIDIISKGAAGPGDQ